MATKKADNSKPTVIDRSRERFFESPSGQFWAIKLMGTTHWYREGKVGEFIPGSALKHASRATAEFEYDKLVAQRKGRCTRTTKRLLMSYARNSASAPVNGRRSSRR
jgi:hypothetical protein